MCGIQDLMPNTGRSQEILSDDCWFKWNSVFSENISQNFFTLHPVVEVNFGCDSIRIRSLGARDERALSASDGIASFSEGLPLIIVWRTRRNLGELCEVLDAHWFGRLLSSNGNLFSLYQRDLSCKACNLDALVLTEVTETPRLRHLLIDQRASADDIDLLEYNLLYQYFEPDRDPEPVIGHIW
jgi:hypothetical protein